MQYNWKIFKWNDANDRTDLTQYLIVPIFLELRCNEQLSSGQVTLDCVPTNFCSSPFAPKTKFTLERYVGESMDKYFDFVVDRDDVEFYSGCNEICCHRIQLIEPSVFAQGMHCDNFALTYELNDVTLKYKTIISSDEKAIPYNSEVVGRLFQRPDWNYGTGSNDLPHGIGWYKDAGNFTTYYTNSYIYKWSGLEALDAFNASLNGQAPHDISFTMPIIKCYANNGTNVAYELFDCPTRCRVYCQMLKNGLPSGSETLVKSQLYNPPSVKNVDENDRFMYNIAGLAGLRGTKTGQRSFRNASHLSVGSKVFMEDEIVNLPAMINVNNINNSSREVAFSTMPLTEDDFNKELSYQYSIELVIEPYQSGAFIQQISYKCITVFDGGWFWGLFGGDETTNTVTLENQIMPAVTELSASVKFLCRNMAEKAPSNPFLLKGDKYKCFNLFRKAMLTCDTQILDNKQIGLDAMYDNNGNEIGIQYPIEVDDKWEHKMKDTVMYESVFENKNLWEVLQQIGNYLHAIPYLEFARNGKDRFVLKFKQLGGSTMKNNNSNKITIFNSRTLDNFFTQYDSYVQNLFSPQNEIDERIACKTSDSSYLISNNTAELYTKYNITEIVEFDITYKKETKSALEYLFEKSIYDVLTSKTSMLPAKWCALYYERGTNKILGLNYVPPTEKNDGFMALKSIVAKLFTDEIRDANVKFNDLKFHIRYKTQDSLRITQLRPDLEQFVKNSEFEKYPHNEQFYGPQDKIVDSERFSANLWGRLLRVANGIYQMQEYAGYGEEKEPGDLVQLNDGNYYVTEVENEYYPSAVLQKVTYSKNFNQLSNIVTIPSEPRFYEISERQTIRREVRLLEFIKLSTCESVDKSAPRYMRQQEWHAFIRNLLFADEGNPILPNSAYINFKGDKFRKHFNLENNNIDVLFPSSEARITEDNMVEPMPSAAHRAVIVPVLHFPLKNAIVFEWDMDDNFKAGDSIDVSISGAESTVDSAYVTMQSVRYTDIYGRADLFDFKLFYKDDWIDEQINRLPFAEDSDFKPTEEQSVILLPDSLSIGLDKDNREALSFNYQLSLLHEPHSDDQEDFIIFSNLFGRKEKRLKVALLNIKASLFAETISIDAKTTVSDEDGNLMDNIIYTFANNQNSLEIIFEEPTKVNMTDVRSIVFYDTDNGTRYAYIAKNVERLSKEKKLISWHIYPVFNQ